MHVKNTLSALTAAKSFRTSGNFIPLTSATAIIYSGSSTLVFVPSVEHSCDAIRLIVSEVIVLTPEVCLTRHSTAFSTSK